MVSDKTHWRKTNMHKSKSSVDKDLFDYHFERFKKHVMDESGRELTSFSSNPYTKKQEGYKEEIYYQARNLLNFESWSILDVGNGNIIKSVIAAIEIKENNLVQWQPKYGEDSSQHQPLRDELTNGKKLIVYEKDLFNLYRDTDDKKAFEKLVNIFGHKYPIVAYLFFLKDKTQYMPIAPTYFDKAFKILGINLITSHKCSWDNYQAYNTALENMRLLIAEKLQTETSLLDAHSCAWMLGTKLAIPDKDETK
jgi:hypothetical protein